MPDPGLSDIPWTRLILASERMATCRSMDAVVAVLRETAREITGADGVCVVLRDRGFCHYVAEDAVAPLWAGQRFPAETCVSGWAMMNRQTAAIPDILDDPRVPQAAYAATFVRSMVMVPIGQPEAVAAIGAYWADARSHDPTTVARLEALSRSAALAIENANLLAAIEHAERDRRALLEAEIAARTRDLAETQEALRQSQKLEAMGQLTGGVAHDFNNLLTPILGSLDLLKRRSSGDVRELRLLDAALVSAERAKMLVQRLLTFARRQPLSPAPVDIAALLLELSPLIGTTIGPQIDLSLDISDALPLALADQNQIEMAILNLVVNARDAMPDGGRIRVSAQPDLVAGAHPAGIAAGSYVRVAITDTGTGMDAETIRRAIEPFFSTKGIGKGTGLGLSMVHGLAAQLGGGLRITSEPGLGTAVEFWLPETVAPVVATVTAAPVVPSAPGTVLVVDDEPLVRASTVEMLRDLGFTTLEAGNAVDALGLLAMRRDIDLLVTDHLMPGMTGGELATEARARWPAIPALIVSGYADAHSVAAGFARLEKPFRQVDLATGIAAVLHAS